MAENIQYYKSFQQRILNDDEYKNLMAGEPVLLKSEMALYETEDGKCHVYIGIGTDNDPSYIELNKPEGIDEVLTWFNENEYNTIPMVTCKSEEEVALLSFDYEGHYPYFGDYTGESYFKYPLIRVSYEPQPVGGVVTPIGYGYENFYLFTKISPSGKSISIVLDRIECFQVKFSAEGIFSRTVTIGTSADTNIIGSPYIPANYGEVLKMTDWKNLISDNNFTDDYKEKIHSHINKNFLDTLTPEILEDLNSNSLPIWQPNTDYRSGDIIQYIGRHWDTTNIISIVLKCKEDHRSGDTITKDEYGYWVEIYDLTAYDNTDRIQRLQYYGDANITPTDVSYFTFETDDETMTATINGADSAKELTEIVIPYKYVDETTGKEYKVTNINIVAFRDFTNLTSIKISNSVTSIGNGAFYGCTSLTSIAIPSSVTSIENLVFSDCKNLISITIPESVISIGHGAFGGCTSLTSIIIPDRVTSIGNSAFGNCSNLTNITIGKGITSIGSSAFASCESLTNITIPESVISIGHGAFMRCKSLTSVTIPNSVTSIGDEVFHMYSDGGEAINIPNLVISCSEGSYAETYAKKNRIVVQYIGLRSSIKVLDTEGNGVFAGDVFNKNGKLFGKSELIANKYLHSLGYTSTLINNKNLGVMVLKDGLYSKDFEINFIKTDIDDDYLTIYSYAHNFNNLDFSSLKLNDGLWKTYTIDWDSNKIIYINDDNTLAIKLIDVSMRSLPYAIDAINVTQFELLQCNESTGELDVIANQENKNLLIEYLLNITGSGSTIITNDKIKLTIKTESRPTQLTSNFNEGDIYNVKLDSATYPIDDVINTYIQYSKINFKIYSQNSFELAIDGIENVLTNNKNYSIYLVFMYNKDYVDKVFSININDPIIVPHSNYVNVMFNNSAQIAKYDIYSLEFKAIEISDMLDELMEDYGSLESTTFDLSVNSNLNNDIGLNIDYPPNLFDYANGICIYEKMSVTNGDILYFNGINWVKIYDNFPKAGISNNRPITPCMGQQFFDSTLNKPIWYNGTTWVDCNGVIC